MKLEIFWSEMKDAVCKTTGLSHSEINSMEINKFFVKIESLNKKNG